MQKWIIPAMDAVSKAASGAQGKNGSEFSTRGSVAALMLYCL